MAAVGERQQAPSLVAAHARTRAQAFTLFIRSYDELRRAVVFLRWREGNADRFSPSLYAGRRSSRSERIPDDQEPPTVPGTEPPGGNGPSPKGPAPQPGGTVPSVPSGSARPIAPGMPGGTPFSE